MASACLSSYYLEAEILPEPKIQVKTFTLGGIRGFGRAREGRPQIDSINSHTCGMG